jgi:dihydroorotase
MHEGAVSMRIGLHGIPAEAEEVGIARALALARLAGVRLHLTHVTTARGVELVRRARAEGQRVTAAVPARHLVLADEDVDRSGYDPNLRLVPPLRPPSDRAALIEAVKGAELDVVSADHIPLTRVEKEHEFSAAAPGGTGLETAFSAALTALGDLAVAVRALAVAPGRILGLDPRIAPGARAHLAIVEPGAEHVVGPPRESRGSNEPLAGRRLRGRVRATLVGGRLACGAVRGVIA